MTRSDRMSFLNMIALPTKDNPRYDKILKSLDRHQTDEHRKDFSLRQKKAIAILEAQQKNGAGLYIDQDLRYYLEEFNSRAWNTGLRTMPSSFNVMEAFFSYQAELNTFLLLEEEDFLIDFVDFIDYVTSTDCPNLDESVKAFEDNTIYNFNVTNNPIDIDFALENKDIKYIIGGVSIIKRVNEISVIILAGEKNSDVNIPKITELMRFPSKQEIQPSPESKMEKIRFWENKEYWKTFILLRFNIETLELEAKYVQKDLGNAFDTTTDDLEAFMYRDNKFPSEQWEQIYNEIKEKTKNYVPLFEVGRLCIHLLSYIENYEENLILEEHTTILGTEPNKPKIFKRDKLVPPSYELRKRDVWCLKKQRENYASQTITYNESFKLESDGFWKILKSNEIGEDKNGNTIHGKTWVSVLKTWHEVTNEHIKITNNLKPLINSKNKGYIYIMRNASHDKDIFKVGLTRRETETRAKELYSTGVPDKYLVAEEFETVDCVLAEKLIHQKLEKYRLNDKREFFKAQYSTIRKIVNEIVNEVNNS